MATHFITFGHIVIAGITFGTMVLVVIQSTIFTVATVFAYITHASRTAEACVAKFVFASIEAAFTVNAMCFHLPVAFFAGKTIFAYKFAEETALTALKAMIKIVNIAILTSHAVLAPDSFIEKACFTFATVRCVKAIIVCA